MDNLSENNFAKLKNYLSKILTSDNITKLEFSNFDLKYQSDYDDLVPTITKSIENLLVKNERNPSLCVDLVRALLMVVSHKWPDIAENIVSTNIGEDYDWLKSLMDLLGEKFNTILYFGALAFITSSHQTLSSYKSYLMIDQNMIHVIPSLLTDFKYTNIMIHATDAWLTLLLEKEVERNDETIIDILRSLVSVISAFWNHHSIQRSCMEKLILKTLSLDYSKMKQNQNGRIMDTIFFKYMMDISWKIPFKYFVCLHLFKFAISLNEMQQMLNVTKEELSYGFTKILKNKSAVGVEMELFIFCLNNFPYEDWNDIVEPIVYSALLKKSSGYNLSKWWLPQISKKYPVFIESFYKNLKNHVDKESYPRVLVTTLKICYSRKINLPRVEEDEAFLDYLKSLFSSAEEIRGDVFALVCELHDQSVLHSEKELSTVMIFLKFNINSNCTMLRQTMLASFSKFVLRLICSCVRIVKKFDVESDEKMILPLKFLQDLYNFIVNGIRPGCSYQRKIASLNLYKILMTYAVRDCGDSIHRNNLNDAEKFVDFARKKHCWNFESDEIRKLLFYCFMNSCEEVQNLASILLRNYFRLDYVQSKVFEEALNILKDNQFYKRSSGVSAVISLISMAYTSYDKLCITMYIESTSFLEFFLQLLESKIEIMNKDILEAAVNHPLDADIKVLNFLITNATSPEFEYVSKQQIERMITLLEEIVPQLLMTLFLDKSSDYAPSFEESDLALSKLIETSDLRESITSADDSEHCQLQPLNQLLLNFIWVTLKVCSEFASDLIISRIDLLTQDQIIRCCSLIINKLKLCRHKGVIEAAGVALSNVVRMLTTRNICVDWLESVVMDVIHLIEFKSGATISRKSGGLSILIQNVIASDKRPSKPLIGKCWTEFKRILNVNYESINADASEEIPQTHALHLLRVVVADARNGTDLLPYLEEMTILCLTTLKAPVWLIRNAAFQLFGAILPRIAGQRNATPEIGVRHSFEEIFLTMPGILDCMILSMEQTSLPSHASVQHADLAPLLVILMNLKLCSTIILNESLREKLLVVRVIVENLLNSDLYTIRELASKSFLALYSPEELRDKVNSILSDVTEYITYGGKRLQGENHIHGCLLLLKQVYDIHPQFQPIISKSGVTLSQSLSISLVSQALLFEMEMINGDVSLDDFFHHIEHVLDILPQKRYLCMGYEQWLRAIFVFILKRFSHVIVLRKCLNCSQSLILLACLDNLFEKRESIYSELLLCLKRYLSQNDETVISHIIQTFIRLYESGFKISFNNDFIEEHFDVMIDLDYYRFQGVNVHFLGILVANSGYCIDDTLEIILETLDIIRYNKNIRLNSAYCMLNLSKILNHFNVNKKLVWRILVNLIQDEEADIRFIGSACFVNIFQVEIDYGPEMATDALFDPDIVCSYLSNEDLIELLWTKLEIISFEKTIPDQTLNPFDQGVVNCYEEEVKIVSLAGEAMKKLIAKTECVSHSHFTNEKIRKYFEVHCVDILRDCGDDRNEFFIYASEYVLTLKRYYLLYIYQCVNKSVEKEVKYCIENLEKLLKI